MKIFNLPDLGEGLAEAEIRAWHVHAGDVVEVDQPMVSVETAKAVVDVPAPCAGKIVKLHGKVGDTIKTHAPLVEFAGDQGSVVGVLETGEMVLPEAVTVTAATAAGRADAVKVMPAVRAFAQRLGVDLATVRPAGAHITVEDVKAAAGKAGEAPGEVLHGVRRTMAQTMARSGHEVVPATIMDDADVTDCVDFTVALIQAMVSAAAAEPSLNASFSGEHLSRTLHRAVNLGLAVDTPEGLFVPVIKNAGALSAAALREAVNHLKEAATARTLTPAEFHGATVMLSNFGTIAGRYASPVLVPPMVAILGCGKVAEAVVAQNGKMAIRKMAPLSLTFDHRAVTGGEASRYLAAVIQSLQRKGAGGK